MNMQSKVMRRIHSLFRIHESQSWSRVSAADILAVPDVGKGTLNKLRLYLAHRGVSLRGDNPPAYWIDVLKSDGNEGQLNGVCPFRIVIDSNESNPFTFDAIEDRDGRTISIPTIRKPLYLSALADYTIENYELDIQIERKADDLYSSMSERRDIFEGEISRLNSMCEFAAVICEIPRSTVITDNNRHGARAKSIINTVSHWRVRYPGVHFVFADGRWDAEQECWRLLSAFWWSKMRERSQGVIAEVVSGIFEEV